MYVPMGLGSLFGRQKGLLTMSTRIVLYNKKTLMLLTLQYRVQFSDIDTLLLSRRKFFIVFARFRRRWAC